MAINKQNRSNLRKQRAKRVRVKIFGTAKKPRLNVFRSLKGVYAQLIDDQAGKTLVSASSLEVKDKAKKTEIATKVGELLAQKASKAGINQAVLIEVVINIMVVSKQLLMLLGKLALNFKD